MTSLNEQMRGRFEKRRTTRHVVAYVFVLSSMIYITWRVSILNFDAPFISIMFLVAEVIGFLIALGAIFLSSNYSSRRTKPAPIGLDVDVFIPVYKEPIDVIRRTITAASKIRYPHRTVILDDGKSPEVKELCKTLGCIYLSRNKNSNAKAGNLNFGFEHSAAEFVMVFDADHIPQADALDKMLGYFDDEKIAFAQAPQDFYNIDSIQFRNSKDGGLWHDQSFFYHLALPNADTFGGPICVGTGVIYRRSSIDVIGGFPTDTVTEDLHTSLKLQKSGFETAYHHESVAYGIGEIGLEDYYVVRQRWGHGNIHALRLENILYCKGLNLRQRLNYLMVGLNYLEGWQYLIFYLVPIYSLLTGVAPFEITPLNIAIMILFPVFTYLLVQEFTCGFGRFWVNELFAMMRFPIAILSTFALFRDQLTWRSSKKIADGRIEVKLMLPQLSIIVFSLAALIYCVGSNWENLKPGIFTQMFMNPEAVLKTDFNKKYDDGFSTDLLLIAGFWALFNVIRGLVFIWKIVNSARNSSQEYMFQIPLLFELDAHREKPLLLKTSTISLSEVVFEEPFTRSESDNNNNGILHLPGKSLPIKIISNGFRNQKKFEFEFHLDSDKYILEEILYSVKWHRELFHSQAEFLTPLGLLEKWLGISEQKSKTEMWTPKLLDCVNGDKKLVYSEVNSGRILDPVE